MKYPKKIKSICPHCKKHQDFNVSIYKKSKERVLSESARRYKRKKRGYGSQPKPIFRKNAKVNKKTLPLLKCTVCGHIKHGTPQRIKKFELIAK